MVTNDIYTTEDADFLLRNGVLPADRIRAVETGCCPHTAIRDDISANLDAVEDLEATLGPLDLVLVESGGDNLTATFSKGLIDRQIFVVDVAGGDKVPRKGGPGVTAADLLVINKTDLAPLVGADLAVMDRDARARRGDLPTVFLSLVRDRAGDPGRRLDPRAGRGSGRRRSDAGVRAGGRRGRRSRRHPAGRAARRVAAAAAPHRAAPARASRCIWWAARPARCAATTCRLDVVVGSGRIPRPYAASQRNWPSPATRHGRRPAWRSTPRWRPAARCTGCPSP